MRLLGHRESLNMDFERQFLSSLKARTLEYSLEYRSVPTSSGSVLGLRQTPAVGNAESQSAWRPVETALALTVRCASLWRGQEKSGMHQAYHLETMYKDVNISTGLLEEVTGRHRRID
jgi:hypothetical protein